MATKHLINRQITAPVMTVIGPDGKKYGPLRRYDAYDLAAQHELDLVLVSPEPPVAKLMDYGKFCFEEKKKAKERANDPDLKRKQNLTDIKEITLSYKIAGHDEQVIVDRASQFINRGHTVRFAIRLRGREMAHTRMAVDLLNRIAEKITPKPKIQRAPALDGNRVIMVVTP